MALPGPPQRQPLSPSPVRKKTAQERTSAMKKEEKSQKAEAGVLSDVRCNLQSQ